MNTDQDTFDYNRHVVFRGLLASLFITAALMLNSGCTYTRNAPLINVQDSANGNTVPVSAAP